MRNTNRHESEHPRVRNILIAVVQVVFLSLFVAIDADAQTTSQKPQLPQRIVYWQLFRHVNFLEQQANTADQRGQDSSSLRNYYQQRANLTLAETALLKQTASKTAAAVQSIDNQIKDVVTRFRAGFKPASKTDLPSPPPELTTLQAQRDKGIMDQLAALQSGLGPARFQQFDTYVQTRFAPRISVTRAVPPPPADPTKLPQMPAQ